MSGASEINELITVIRRVAELEEMLGSDVSYSVLAARAHPTGKTGNHFLRAPDITTELVGSWVQRALASRVGVRRDYAVDGLASLVNVDTKTIQNYTGGAAPSAQNLFRLIAFFGPEFASELLAPLGLAVVESDSALAAQSLSIESMKAMLPQLRQHLDILEQQFEGQGGEHG